MADLPTLSHMRSYTSTHLTEAAIHWDDAAERWRSVYGAVHSETLGLTREGQTQDASVDRITTDHQTVTRNADALSSAASIARTQAPTLDMMAKSVTHLADEATENGFYVGDDYEVTDVKRGTTLQEFIARDAQAEQYSADLRFRAGNFSTHEGKTAQDLIQAVDNDLTVDTHASGGAIPDPPAQEPDAGKQWWYHEGTGWKQEDHLQECDPKRTSTDIASIVGGIATTLSPAILTPPGWGAEANEIRGIIDINQCEGP